MKYVFDVEVKESGQRRSYGDSYYSYFVTSKHEPWMVKSFCMKVLKQSYPKADMPTPFSGELLLFKKITNNNETLLGGKEETYEYKVRCEYTG